MNKIKSVEQKRLETALGPLDALSNFLPPVKPFSKGYKADRLVKLLDKGGYDKAKNKVASWGKKAMVPLLRIVSGEVATTPENRANAAEFLGECTLRYPQYRDQTLETLLYAIVNSEPNELFDGSVHDAIQKLGGLDPKLRKEFVDKYPEQRRREVEDKIASVVDREEFLDHRWVRR